MYRPAFTIVDDEQEARAMVTAARSGWLVTSSTEQGPVATLLPIMWQDSRLIAHMAKANPHWRDIRDGERALVIISGPEAYVSPSWYPSKAEHGRVVPTWNYVAVHLAGPVSLHHDPEWLLGAVTDLTNQHEQHRPRPWHVTDAPREFIDAQLKAIVGIEVLVDRVEAKAKASQNRPEHDRLGVIDGLAADAHQDAEQMLGVMRETAGSTVRSSPLDEIEGKPEAGAMTSTEEGAAMVGFMDLVQFDAVVSALPRHRVGFYPTPFHRVENMSARLGIDLFMKREDLAGPSAISGSKTRLAEFIVGRAKQAGVTHLISQGAYLTNSGLQLAAVCRAARITPALVLTRNLTRHGELGEARGNYLLNQVMGVRTEVINVRGNYWEDPVQSTKITDAVDALKAELETEGHTVLVVGIGGAHPDGFIAHAVTFREMLEQSADAGVELDLIYHTIGTGTALPGMLAAKLSLGHPVKFRSIAINGYNDDDWMNRAVIVERTKAVLTTLGVPVPDDAVIAAEIDIDQRFIGDDYAVPTPESSAAIRELANADGIFVGPVYTGKGLAGLLDHARTGRIPFGSKVAFVHTGDTGNLFEIAEVVGNIERESAG